LCGFRTRHSFYFIDAPTPAIGEYDLMNAAKLVVNVANRRVWSRRPESATKGPIGPNPEFPLCNSSVHFSVAMTKPQRAHCVVVSETTASSPEDLDIKASPASLRFFGNSMSSSQATFEQPSAHSGLVAVQRSRPPSLGCGIPVTTTLRPLAKRPVGSAPGETGQVKHASKTFGVLAPRKHRRTVSGDLLTLPQELSESATSTDVNQPDVKRAHSGRTPQCFCVNVTQSEEEEDVVATIVEVNQCYQDHVHAVRSRFVYCMLSDTECSDFDESDEDEEWAKCRQSFWDYMEKSAHPDFDVVTNKKEIDVADQEVEVSPSQYPVDVFQFESKEEVDSPDLPSPTQSRDAPTESVQPDSFDLSHFTPYEVASTWAATMQMQQKVYAAYQSRHEQQLQQEQLRFSEAESTCPAFIRSSPTPPLPTTGPSPLDFD